MTSCSSTTGRTTTNRPIRVPRYHSVRTPRTPFDWSSTTTWDRRPCDSCGYPGQAREPIPQSRLYPPLPPPTNMKPSLTRVRKISTNLPNDLREPDGRLDDALNLFDGERSVVVEDSAPWPSPTVVQAWSVTPVTERIPNSRRTMASLGTIAANGRCRRNSQPGTGHGPHGAVLQRSGVR